MKKTFKFFSKWIFVFSIWGLIALIGIIGFYAYDLPNLNESLNPNRASTIRIYDRNHALLSSYGDNYGRLARINNLPDYVPNAIIAIEDKRFYHHFGIDPIGILRAIYENVASGNVKQGASTLTQQVVKNIFLTPERTLKRKIQETILALWLEHKLSKQEILEIYLNRVYFGAGCYGVDAAAQKFFGKKAQHLSLYEATILAGLLKAPSKFNPIINPEKAHARAQLVYQAMEEQALISKKQAKEWQSNSIARAPATATFPTRYFTDWLVPQVQSFRKSVASDVFVDTSFDPNLQVHAYNIIERHLAKDPKLEIALIAMGLDGSIKTMIGGRNYGMSEFNRATQALRQPGSAFKLFVYITALENGYSPYTEIEDIPRSFGDWQPKNYGHNYRGQLNLREAFAFSSNSIAAKLTHDIGLDKVKSTARKLGISSAIPHDLTISLGSNTLSLLELTAAYAVVANGGYAVLPYAITKIRDDQNQILYQRTGSGLGQVVSEGTIKDMRTLLHDVLVYGTARGTNFDFYAGGKTGTTSDYRDALFVGFTDNIVVGVWVGYDDNTPMPKVTGNTIPLQVWKEFIMQTRAYLTNNDQDSAPLY